MANAKEWLRRKKWTLDQAASIWCDTDPNEASPDAQIRVRVRAVRGMLEEAVEDGKLKISHSYVDLSGYGGGTEDTVLVADLVEFAIAEGHQPAFLPHFTIATTAANSVGTVPPRLRSAPAPMIHAAIKEVYDKADAENAKAPNLKEIAHPVLTLLRTAGFQTSARQIQVLAGEPQHALRRRPVGKRVT
jgi:hypothetical protein